MTEYIVIFIVCIAASCLTLYSGFGLGTLLLPVFSLFFPLEIAIASTAIVHFSNNIFKIATVGKYANKAVVVKFGAPAILASFLGALLLGFFSHFEDIARYFIYGREAVITPVKLSVAILISFFALFELIPYLRKLKFDSKYLVLGGFLSGFFGGFSGHQGALRSAFLTKLKIEPKEFVGTNSVIAFMVDTARITTYFISFLAVSSLNNLELSLILTSIVAAFLGVFLGKRFLHKVTMTFVQNLTGVLLLFISIALGTGVI